MNIFRTLRGEPEQVLGCSIRLQFTCHKAEHFGGGLAVSSCTYFSDLCDKLHSQQLPVACDKVHGCSECTDYGNLLCVWINLGILPLIFVILM